MCVYVCVSTTFCMLKQLFLLFSLWLLVLHFAANVFVRGQVAKCRKSSSPLPHQICWKAIGSHHGLPLSLSGVKQPDPEPDPEPEPGSQLLTQRRGMSANALLLEFLHWLRALNFKSKNISTHSQKWRVRGIKSKTQIFQMHFSLHTRRRVQLCGNLFGNWQAICLLLLYEQHVLIVFCFNRRSAASKSLLP